MLGKNFRRLFGLCYLELKYRFKPMRLGVFWSLLKPTFQFIVFYSVFSYIFKVNLNRPNYASELFLGVILWNFFAQSTHNSLYSIINNAKFILNVHMDIHLIPMSSFLVSSFTFILSFVVFLVIYLFTEGKASDHVFIPYRLFIGFISLIMLIYGIGSILSWTACFYRDIQPVWELILIYGIFISPVIYTIPIPDDMVYLYYSLNPIAFPLEMVKSYFFPLTPRMEQDFYWQIIYFLSLFLLLILGYVFMKKIELNIRDSL